MSDLTEEALREEVRHKPSPLRRQPEVNIVTGVLQPIVS